MVSSALSLFAAKPIYEQGKPSTITDIQAAIPPNITTATNEEITNAYVTIVKRLFKALTDSYSSRHTDTSKFYTKVWDQIGAMKFNVAATPSATEPQATSSNSVNIAPSIFNNHGGAGSFVSETAHEPQPSAPPESPRYPHF